LRRVRRLYALLRAGQEECLQTLMTRRFDHRTSVSLCDTGYKADFDPVSQRDRFRVFRKGSESWTAPHG
jgi:hypothetical protein